MRHNVGVRMAERPRSCGIEPPYRSCADKHHIDADLAEWGARVIGVVVGKVWDTRRQNGHSRLGALDAPEHSEAAGDHAGDVLAEGGGLPVFAHWDERHILPYLHL